MSHDSNEPKEAQLHHVFPFSAIVGQAELKLALALCVIDPTIGGVMIMGHRGTADTGRRLIVKFAGCYHGHSDGLLVAAGSGAMTFMRVVPERRVGYELFFADFGTTSTGALELEPQGASTRVTWHLNGDMGASPFMRWMGLFADRMMGKDFEAGLANLKTLAEQ